MLGVLDNVNHLIFYAWREPCKIEFQGSKKKNTLPQTMLQSYLDRAVIFNSTGVKFLWVEGVGGVGVLDGGGGVTAKPMFEVGEGSEGSLENLSKINLKGVW